MESNLKRTYRFIIKSYEEGCNINQIQWQSDNKSRNFWQVCSYSEQIPTKQHACSNVQASIDIPAKDHIQDHDNVQDHYDVETEQDQAPDKVADEL